MTAIEEWITCYFQNLLGQVQDKNLVFIRIYSLLGRILKFLYEMNLDTGDLEREIIQVYTRFDSFRTYEQFVKWLTQLCAPYAKRWIHPYRTITIRYIPWLLDISGKTLKPTPCA